MDESAEGRIGGSAGALGARPTPHLGGELDNVGRIMMSVRRRGAHHGDGRAHNGRHAVVKRRAVGVKDRRS